MGWLAGTTILDWACGDSAMNEPRTACSPCFPSRWWAAASWATVSGPTMLGDHAQKAIPLRRAPHRPVPATSAAPYPEPDRGNQRAVPEPDRGYLPSTVAN